MKQLITASLGPVWLALYGSIAAGAVLYVDSTPEDGAWIGCYTDLQEALSLANRGDEIWVARGKYRPTTGSDRARSFELVDEVAVYGGFSGTETDRGARDWSAHPTVLSGDIGVVGDDSDNCYQVVVGAFLATLDGFVITGGRSPGDGGGMYNSFALNYSGVSEVANCVFIDNHADGFGGGVANGPEAELTLHNCVFVDNSAGDAGGALANHTLSSAALVNCLLMDNSAGTRGGAIANHMSSVELLNCTLAGNSAPQGGGLQAGDIWAGAFTLAVNTIFWENSADSGMQISQEENASLMAERCDIQGGLAGIVGGEVEDLGGNIDDDPLFVNPAARDFHLTAGSPCIDAGAASRVGYDLDGKPRPLDGDRDGHAAFDIGAYEFPEPCTLALLATGALSLLARIRRKRRRCPGVSVAPS